MVNCRWVSDVSDEKTKKVLSFVIILSKPKIFPECEDFLFGIRVLVKINCSTVIVQVPCLMCIKYILLQI